ncbi:MAG: aminotransferase class III-fold pyridoxal phosphate-dependent enzyme [Deltaproteobacteria bacterium]|nr:aminotransferase class III-fold pyridoxal phosphate-dependent enzyme [Deltaproteobacteria bacterium]
MERLNLDNSLKLFEEAKRLIPGGVGGARRPYNFVPGEYPIFLESGKGGRIVDVDGNEYIDFVCGFGPIILGYREQEVDEAVVRQIRDRGFCFTLTQRFQNQLAERLNELIPCSEMCVFCKTGSDGTTASIRIARGYTNRIKVMRCGYHGWHDWCVEVKGGIPEKLYEDVHEFRYNDLAHLEDLMEKYGDETAAIILTPFGHPLHERLQEPAPGFLEGVRDAATRYGAVLIYDEIRTGFRLSMGGAQEYYKVAPDLAVFGKGMANGYAISAVTGRREIMSVAEQEVFISSTFFPNSTGYVAALKTIEILEREKVIEKIWEMGNRFLERLGNVLNKYDVGAELSGIGPMFFVIFKRDRHGTYKARRKDFYTQLIRRGIFLHPHHHGYICYRHTEEELERAIEAVDQALDYVNERHGAFEQA